MSVTSSIRNTSGAPEFMARRAWWLVGIGILIPGSAQLLAGNRRFGRFAVAMTFLFWALCLALVVLYFFARSVFLVLVTNSVLLFAGQVTLALYAVLWIVVGLDTLRLVRLVRVPAVTRVAVAAVAVISIMLAAGGAGYGAVVAGSARGLLDRVFSSDRPVEPPVEGRYNILLLGGDAGPDRLGLRPDSISVVSIDAATGAAAIIGIPRNLELVPFAAGSPLWGPFPNGYDCGNECLISYLYTYGVEHPELYPEAERLGSNAGVEAMRDAAEGVTGLELQYFVLIDMQGFSDLIDALGGVDITVAEEVVLGLNGSSPIGVIPAGPQRMDGATALWFARSRYETTDYERMERQRQVQEAILVQFEPANVLSKFQAVANASERVVKTDIPQGMLGAFVDLAAKTRALPVSKVELTPDSGVVTARPDYALIQSLVQQALIVPTATPTPTPTP